jgi:hypothetical protein
MRHRSIGSKHGMAKITEEDARNLKALLAHRRALRIQLQSLTYQKIAEKFDLHEGHIRRIDSGRNWAHL